MFTVTSLRNENCAASVELHGCMFAAVQVQAQFELQVFVTPTSPTRISKKFGLFVRASCEAFSLHESASSRARTVRHQPEGKRGEKCARAIFPFRVQCNLSQSTIMFEGSSSQEVVAASIP